jgi:hypothetical protein
MKIGYKVTKGDLMKKILIMIMTIGASISHGSGCDSKNIIETTGSLQSIQVESDLGELPLTSIDKIVQTFKDNYGNNIDNALPELPKGSQFRVRTQWATYKYLDTDCGWELNSWTVSMKQLVIQISDHIILVYPSLQHLKGEEIKDTPYLKITAGK